MQPALRGKFNLIIAIFQIFHQHEWEDNDVGGSQDQISEATLWKCDPDAGEKNFKSISPESRMSGKLF